MNNKWRRVLAPPQALRIERALGFVWESGPGWTVANAVLVLVQGLLPLVSLYITKLLVDAVAAGAVAQDKHTAFRRVGILIGFAAAAAIFSALCRSIGGLVRETQAQAVTDHMYDILHAKSVEVDLLYYEDPRYHDTLHRSQREAPVRPMRIVNSLVGVGQSGFTLLAIAGLLCSFHWALVAVLLAGGVPGVLARMGHARKVHRWQREKTSTERKAWYFSWMLTGDAHAKEIRLFGLGPLFIKRFRELRAQIRREMLRIAAGHSVTDMAAQASAAAAAFGSYAFIEYRAVQGAITMGDLVMYSQALYRGQECFRQIMSGLADLYEDQLFLTNLYEFLDLKQKIAEPAHPRPVPRPMRTGIAFEGVSFVYPGGTKNILDGISLAIRPGEMVALVGENGSGKTTLIKLLCRLYDPTAGRITLDGIDLREFSTTALRRKISVIFQDFVRYHLTAGENIRLGNLALDPDDERIIAAARQSGAEEVIERLPRGYRTPLGKWFDDGDELSTGEWHKLALARACVGDSQILVLDEPTSALDVRAECALFKNSRQIIADRAAVIISHRFSTVRMADCIYVLRGGRIVEHGNHKELMRAQGFYARMFEMQAGPYLA